MYSKDTKMDVILPEDLQEIVRKYDNKIYSETKTDNLEELDKLKIEVYEQFDTIFDLSNKTDLLLF